MIRAAVHVSSLYYHETSPRGYKKFPCSKYNPSHKCKNAINCWHFNIYLHDKKPSERLKTRNFFIYRYFNFYEQLKFHA